MLGAQRAVACRSYELWPPALGYQLDVLGDDASLNLFVRSADARLIHDVQGQTSSDVVVIAAAAAAVVCSRARIV